MEQSSLLLSFTEYFSKALVWRSSVTIHLQISLYGKIMEMVYSYTAVKNKVMLFG